MNKAWPKKIMNKEDAQKLMQKGMNVGAYFIELEMKGCIYNVL